jgi:hypothetical protein
MGSRSRGADRARERREHAEPADELARGMLLPLSTVVVLRSAALALTATSQVCTIDTFVHRSTSQL